MEQALVQLDTLPVPASPDAQVLAQLKQSLRALLEASGRQRWTAAAPATASSQVNDLRVYAADGGAALANWSYRNQGDYDQNSEANISDLTPIATFFRRTSAWPLWTRALVADGDANGEVNIADLTPLGQCLLSKVDAYAVECAASASAEQWDTVGTVNFAASTLPVDGGVRRFSFGIAAAVSGMYYRVVPLFGEERGIPSLPFQYIGASMPTYTISGTVCDGSGAPMAGVAISLDSQADAVSGADGSFSFAGLPEGFSGTLTPRADGITFFPLQRGVYVGSGDVTAMDFTCLPQLTLTKWQGGAEAAISLSFDDGTPDHWSRGMPLWQEYGFRVTLGIMSSRFEDHPERIPQLQQAFDAGHELANHTRTHADLTDITPEEARAELSSCDDFLHAHVSGLGQVITAVYPYELFNDDVTGILQDMGYLCARSGAQEPSDHAMLNDPYNPPLLHLYSWAALSSLLLWQWDSTTEVVLNDGGWLIEQCHGIGEEGEDGVGWSPRPESEYRAHYDHIKSFGDRVWVAPMGEVARFLVERNTAQLSVTSWSEDSICVELNNTLSYDYLDVPLTISMKLPAGWNGACAEQNGNALTVKASGDGTHVLFDAVPDGGVIAITAVAP